MSFFGKTEKEILEAMGYDTNASITSMENYKFPEVVVSRTQEILGCTDEEMELVQIGLLDYFLTVKNFGGVEMIDKKADELWHVFLWDTQAYMEFCAKHVGFYIHHNPYMDEKEMTEPEKELLKTRYKKALITDSGYSRRRDTATSNYNNNGGDDFMMWLPFYAMMLSDDVAAVQVETDRVEAERVSTEERLEAERVADTTSHDTSRESYTPASSYSDDSSSGSSYTPSSSSCSSSSSSSSCSSSSSSSSSCGSSCGS